MNDKTDEELMQSYQRGALDAFESLYRRHAPKVYGYLVQKLGDTAAANDVLQEIFLRIHKYRSRYDSSFPFIPWLFSISKNALTDHAKRAAARREVAMEGEEISGRLAVAAPGPVLREYLASLSEREREILTLHFEEGRSFREIAQRLSLSPENARKLSSRAIQKLRSLWK